MVGVMVGALVVGVTEGAPVVGALVLGAADGPSGDKVGGVFGKDVVGMRVGDVVGSTEGAGVTGETVGVSSLSPARNRTEVEVHPSNRSGSWLRSCARPAVSAAPTPAPASKIIITPFEVANDTTSEAS